MINCLIDDLQKCNRVAIHLEFRELTFDKKSHGKSHGISGKTSKVREKLIFVQNVYTILTNC